MANAKLARMIESRAFNPEYTFTSTNEEFALGEVAAPIVAFESLEEKTVDRELVVHFFGEFVGRLKGWVGCTRLK